MKRVSIFLITVALVAGMVGCGEVTPPTRYSLAMAVAPAGNGTATDLTNAAPYTAGTGVSIKAVAATGYRFGNWTAPAGTFANASAAETIFTMPAQNVTVTANFVAVYNLTTSSIAGGTVTTPGTGTYTYDAGTVVNLVAAPAAGYCFVNWSGDVSTIANINAATTTITMNGNYSINANFEQEEEVYFADPNLEAAIRVYIHKPEGPIYPADLEGLIVLSAGGANITDLTGLEYCTNLITLSLVLNQISDISPLANLTNLTYLNLYDNQISDISPLANLTNLTWLHLWANEISNISPLSNLTNLRLLYLHSNQISDISPLANLTNLTEPLFLNNNQISDISPLANLTNLTVLYLDYNQISDISPLANLTNLTVLHIWANEISDISPLANLTNLWELSLGHNQISDISPLANLGSLGGLNLRSNQISDISPLVENAELAEGDWVYLQENPLSSDSINIYIPELQARGVTVYYH
jgi:hypothetical protein